LPPAFSISLRAPSKPSRPRATNPIFAPRWAKARAVARPTPADAPVITTTSALSILPLSNFFGLLALTAHRRQLALRYSSQVQEVLFLPDSDYASMKI
jgi:hypothetical protein